MKGKVDMEDLFDKYLRDELSDSEVEELSRLLEQPDVAEALVEYIHQTNALVDSCQLIEAESAKPELALVKLNPKVVSFAPKKSSKMLAGWLVVCAAVIVFGVILLFDQPAAKLQHDYQVSKSSSKFLREGADVGNGLVVVRAGSQVEFQNGSGTSIVCWGPAEVQLLSNKEMIVNKGLVVVSVSDEDKGFVLRSPVDQVRDIGTSFGCDVAERSMEVHVFDGVVEFGEQSKIHVFELEAYLSDGSGVVEKIPFDKEKFFPPSRPFIDGVLEDVELLSGEVWSLPLGQSTRQFSAHVELMNLGKHADSMTVEVRGDGELLKVLSFSPELMGVFIDLSSLQEMKELQFQLKCTEAKTNGLKWRMSRIAYSATSPLHVPKVLIASGENWHYTQASEPRDSVWRSALQAPEDWTRAKSGFGYSRKGKWYAAGTQIPPSDDPLYLHKVFYMGEELAENSRLFLHALVDDGAVVYMNGQEVLRLHMDEGAIDYSSRAISRNWLDEHYYRTYEIEAKHLKKGANVIAVEVYQYQKPSKDLFFDMKLSVDGE